METVNEIVVLPKNLQYRGSANTFEQTKREILVRFGEAEAERYTPELCRSYKNWLSLNFQVKKGERAIKIRTFVPVKNSEGQELRKIPRVVNLFYILQVEPIVK